MRRALSWMLCELPRTVPSQHRDPQPMPAASLSAKCRALKLHQRLLLSKPRAYIYIYTYVCMYLYILKSVQKEVSCLWEQIFNRID